MAASQTLGGSSRAGRVLGHALDKIIKNAAWRKHSALVAACKSALDRLELISESSETDYASPLAGLSSADADLALYPLSLAVDSASPKVLDPALECAHKLFSAGLFRGEIDHRSDPQEPLDSASRLLGSICGCGGLGDDGIELAMLRVLIAAVRSPSVIIRGEALVQIVKSCYNVYLGSQSAVNQVCAKAVLAQILAFVFARAEADTVEVRVQSVSIADMLDLSDKSLNDSTVVQAAQNFINEEMGGSDPEVSMERKAQRESRDEQTNGGDDTEGGGLGMIREDAIFLFRNLCRFSMKFPTSENAEDPLLMRGKVLSLELLKMVIDNSGPVWRTNERQVFF